MNRTIPFALATTILIVIAVIVGVVVFYTSEQGAPQIPSLTPTPTSLTNQPSAKPVSSKPNVSPTQVSQQFSWAGQYVYTENVSPDQTWEYNLQLKALGTGYTGTLHVDGFQTMSRYIVTATGNTEKLNVYFSKYDTGNIYEPFKAGDLLFSLMPSGKSSYGIKWNILQPNTSNPKAFFTKE